MDLWVWEEREIWGLGELTEALLQKLKKIFFFTNDLLSLMEKKEERKATKYFIIPLRNPYWLSTYYAELACE